MFSTVTRNPRRDNFPSFRNKWFKTFNVIKIEATYFIRTKSAEFFTEYVVLAGVMAETIRFRLSFDKCILFSALFSAALSIVLLLFVFADREATLLEFFQKQIDGHFTQSIEALKTMGDKSEEIKVLQDFAGKASGSLAQAYPSFIALGTLITALVNYYATRFLWRRIDSYDMFHHARFSDWVGSFRIKLYGF